MRRFYHLRVERTLFGGWALIREWGRIGSRRGQTLEEWFDDAEPAEAALWKLENAKRRKGYTLGQYLQPTPKHASTLPKSVFLRRGGGRGFMTFFLGHRLAARLSVCRQLFEFR